MLKEKVFKVFVMMIIILAFGGGLAYLDNRYGPGILGGAVAYLFPKIGSIDPSLPPGTYRPCPLLENTKSCSECGAHFTNSNVQSDNVDGKGLKYFCCLPGDDLASGKDPITGAATVHCQKR